MKIGDTVSEKSISKNAIFNMLNRFLTVIFPLVIISYVSRILGASGVGCVSSAQNFSTYFTMIAALGIPSYGVRAIAQTRNNKKMSDKVFTELYIINLISTCICVIIYMIFLKFMNLDNLSRKLYLLFSILVVFNVFNIEWVYQGFEEYKYITIRNFVIKCSSLVLLFVFVKTEKDVIGYGIIVCFGTVGNYLLNMVNLNKYVKFNFNSINLIQHILPVLTFFGSVVAIEIYSLLDVTMLTHMTNSYYVGYYSNSTKIVKTIAGTLTAISAVLLPRLSLYYSLNDYKKIKKTSYQFLMITLILAIPSVIGLYLLADQAVILVLGNEFIPSIQTIRILTFLIICMPLSGGIFCQLLLTVGKEKEYLISVSMGAFLNMILNYIMISKWYQNGAALASVLSEVVVSALMIYFSRKIIKLNLMIRHIAQLAVANGSMYVVLKIMIRFTNNLSIPIIIRLAIEVLFGGLVYILILFLMKNEYCMEIIYKLTKTKKESIQG